MAVFGNVSPALVQDPLRFVMAKNPERCFRRLGLQWVWASWPYFQGNLGYATRFDRMGWVLILTSFPLNLCAYSSFSSAAPLTCANAFLIIFVHESRLGTAFSELNPRVIPILIGCLRVEPESIGWIADTGPWAPNDADCLWYMARLPSKAYGDRQNSHTILIDFAKACQISLCSTAV